MHSLATVHWINTKKWTDFHNEKASTWLQSATTTKGTTAWEDVNKKIKSLFALLNCSFEPPNEQLFLADHLESAREHKASGSAWLSAGSQHVARREAARHCTSASSALHGDQQHGSIYNPDMYSCSLQWKAGTAGCQHPTTSCLI